MARIEFLPAMVFAVTLLIVHVAGRFRGRDCWKRKGNTIDRVATVRDGLLMLNILQVLGMNGPNTAGVTGAESPLPRSPLVFGPFMPGSCSACIY